MGGGGERAEKRWTVWEGKGRKEDDPSGCGGGGEEKLARSRRRLVVWAEQDPSDCGRQ